jgi:hypothetical protein
MPPCRVCGKSDRTFIPWIFSRYLLYERHYRRWVFAVSNRDIDIYRLPELANMFYALDMSDMHNLCAYVLQAV